MSQLTEPEKSWMACAIDSEGSIVLEPKYNRGNITVANTDLNFIKYAHQLLKPKSKIRSRMRIGLKMIYITTLADKQGLERILPQIIPYLIIKKHKAQTLLNRVKNGWSL